MLTIEKLVKAFEEKGSKEKKRVFAVDGVSLDVQEGSFFTLLGPSGCGKSTTLRCIAGLEKPDTGEIELQGKTLFSSTKKVTVPVPDRGFGMVFQSYAIWPHMTVRRNASFPLDTAQSNGRLSRKERSQRVDQALEVMQLGHLAERQATDLSGGQQQRLALARAIVSRPPLLLLDEPLSNLDASLRDDMRFELKRLQRELGVTTVYVTHDQVEALAMSSLIAVMKDGRIEQLGTPRDIYDRPTSKFVAGFIGTTNFIDGSVKTSEADGTYCVETPTGAFRGRSQVALSPGDPVSFAVRPEHVEIKQGADVTGPNEVVGVVKQKAFVGEALDYIIGVGDLTIRARCRPNTSVPNGESVTVSFGEEFSSVLPLEAAR